MDLVDRFLVGDTDGALARDFRAKLNGLVLEGDEAVAAFHDAFQGCDFSIRGRLEKDGGIAVTCETSDGRDVALRFTFEDDRIHRLAARWA